MADRTDDRIEYGRMIGVRTKLQIAIVLLTEATSETGVTVGVHHDAALAVTEVLRGARVAAAKVDIVIRRIP